jgi:hypothetical protein
MEYLQEYFGIILIFQSQYIYCYKLFTFQFIFSKSLIQMKSKIIHMHYRVYFIY